MREQKENPSISPQEVSKSTVRFSSTWKSKFVSGLYYVRPFQLITHVFQVLFGLMIVGIAMLGLISPLWVAALVNIFGCVLAISGAYVIYDTLSSSMNRSNLVKEAIRHAIDFRN